MDEKQVREAFEKNVEYLQRNIPPDDIYPFAEETFMAALFFLKKWSECVNINVVAANDPIAKKWVINICAFLRCRESNTDISIDLGLESVEGE